MRRAAISYYPKSNSYIMSTSRLHDFFELFGNQCNYLILLVGPQGLEPWTNGL